MVADSRRCCGMAAQRSRGCRSGDRRRLHLQLRERDTHYQNGIDSHVDVGVAQFLSEQLYLGVAGYAYVQVSGDSGSGARLGDFKSRIFAVGPQVGFQFEALGLTWHTVFRADFEFKEKNRAAGWNTFATLVIPVSAPPPHSADEPPD
jgi:hypothetical protein